jgi:hypothetical protein
MRTSGLDRGYEQLTAEERFRLTIMASARTDRTDVERLVRSCPRMTGKFCDPAVSDRHELATDLTILMIATLDAIEGRLDVVEAAKEAGRVMFALAADEAEFEAYRATGEEVPRVRRVVRRERSRFDRLFRRIEASLTTRGATVAHAFAAFSRDQLGLEPAQLVAAVSPPHTDLFERFAAATPNDDAVTALQDELTDVWQSRLGLPAAGEKQT